MLTILRSGFFWAGMLLSLSAYSQHIPLGALPMQYNGSFAGEANAPRINSDFGFKSWDENSSYRGYSLNTSYDQFVPAIRSGIGITAALHHSSGKYGSSDLHQLGLAIAPKFSIGGKYTISPSVDIRYGGSRSSSNLPSPTGFDSEGSAWHSRAGLLFNTDKYYIGYAVTIVDHLAYSNTNGETFSVRRQGFTSSLQLGYTFQRSAESKFSFTPQLAICVGTRYHQYPPRRLFRYATLQAFHLNLKYRQFIWGVNEAGVNTMGVHIGWQTDKVRIMLTNGVGFIRGRVNDPPYTGNLSVRYVFRRDDQ